AFYHSSYVFFFFSSRRRHTRFKCDWSSDVCSSDLNLDFNVQAMSGLDERTRWLTDYVLARAGQAGIVYARTRRTVDELAATLRRSEERRVGKECRSGWASCDDNRKENENAKRV